MTYTGDNDRILEILGRHPANNFLYCTIEFPNDELRKKLCPDAPSIESRLALIKEVSKLGIPVMVGISPFNLEWFEKDISENLDAHIDKLVKAGADSVVFNLIHYKGKRHNDEVYEYMVDCCEKYEERYEGIEFVEHQIQMPAEMELFSHIKKRIPTFWELLYYFERGELDPDEIPFEEIYDAIISISDVSGFLEYEFNTAEFSAMNQRLIKFNECRGLKNMKQVLNYLYINRRIFI